MNTTKTRMQLYAIKCRLEKKFFEKKILFSNYDEDDLNKTAYNCVCV